jgi:NAD(P)H-hydrate epimerase
MRQLDQYTIEQLGVPGVVLMERAGLAVAQVIQQQFPTPARVVILAGTGNNGGDGWVAARHLKQAGWQVSIWLVGKEERLSPDARTFYQVCHQLQIPIQPVGSEIPSALRSDLQQAHVIVDALLGTGAHGSLRPPLAEIISLANQQKGWRVAVDIPTGVDADTGQVKEQAFSADCTVTFAYPKWGHYLYPGADYTGQLHMADIGVVVPARAPTAKVNHPALWLEACQPRSPWTHKGHFGHLLILGGGAGMVGAVRMAGMAAYRTGVGKVTLGVPQETAKRLQTQVLQEMVWPWPGEEQFAEVVEQHWQQRKDLFSAVAIGPGVGRFAGEKEWLRTLLSMTSQPLVLDADALNILATEPSILTQAVSSTIILTPHPGEMARLTGCSIAEVERQRPIIARQFAQQWNVITVLKGRYTLIAFPDGQIVLNPTGSPALAKAGSGDVLTGMIGALLAQKISVEQAVTMAVYLHGQAGEQEAQGAEQSLDVLELIKGIGLAIRSHSS